MAYEFDLGELEGPLADQTDGNAWVVEFILGFDADTDELNVMSVLLFETDENNKLELCFGIRTKSGPELDVVSLPDYSKEKTDFCIPKDNRMEVTIRLREAIELLISDADPEYIIMQTFYPNLEPKALRKYDAVEDTLSTSGYLPQDSWREPDGINYWLFKKQG
ncbi:hypothetical protein RPMA_20355 [Tardiphaga alba]|uniref:DUF695 domain-containing protein n=1 Tax=Tardiphaga alba TaxID=340268 RepID=A0ABX8ABI8_9BRAD|nr:hypothetical protein [Tardiphaga alba]QUS40929.1 hypothetical protein RPMA_20355 [Tardiphaga alba]